MTSNHLLCARRLLWVCCAALGLVIEFAAAPHGAFARTTSQFEALPLVRSRQNHLLLRAFINGKPAWLTVDSGAPVSAIALNRRNIFGSNRSPPNQVCPHASKSTAHLTMWRSRVNCESAD